MGFVFPLEWQVGFWQSSSATVLLPLLSEQRLRCSSNVTVHVVPMCSAWSCSDTLSHQVRNSLQSYRYFFFASWALSSQSAHSPPPPLLSFHPSSHSFCSVVAFFPLALFSVIFSLLLQVTFPELLSVPFLCLQVPLTGLQPSTVICGSPELFCSFLPCWHSTSVRP